MKQLLLSVLMLIGLCTFSNDITAQSSYNKAIGLRGGTGLGITYKKFTSDRVSLEAIARFVELDNEVTSISLGGLYQLNNSIGSMTNGFNWYYGVGASAAFYTGDDAPDGIGVGILGNLGLDYKFSGLPFNISVDWIPTFLVSGDTGFISDNGAVGLRFTF